MTENRDKNRVWKVGTKTLLLGVSGFFLFLFGVILAAAYIVPPSFSQVNNLRQYLPLPVAVIDYRSTISFRELAENTSAVRRFYENQDFSQLGLRVDFSTEDGRKRLKIREKEILNKMLEDRAIEVLARQRDIRITEEMARNGLLRALEEYGSEVTVKENLARLYGWTLDDFQEKIVLPGLYEEKLIEVFQNEVDVRADASTRIQEAQKALENQDFTVVAKEFSEGDTAGNGGTLGWFSLDELTPELQSAVSKQAVGKPGAIVESSLGFHIVLVNEKKMEEEKELYQLSQIFTRKSLFSDWLTSEMRHMRIFVWSPEYVFDDETARVEFQSQDLIDFEKKILEEQDGEAVFTF